MTDRLTLRAGAMTVSVLETGATLEQVSYEGTPLTLAHEDPSDYASLGGYLGALVGPVANRIAGASFEIDGIRAELGINEPPSTTLHGGAGATHQMAWTVRERSETSVVLDLVLPHGHGGFPGNRQITAQYDLSPEVLTLTVSATTDQPTPINFANHSLWHLGQGPTYAGLTLALNAPHVTPVDDKLIPLGTVTEVPSGLDFSHPRILPADDSLPFDHNMVLAGSGFREAARLEGNGLRLILSTDQPGLQIFDGRSHGYRGLAMEAQRFPDAPNQWPEQVTLRPGEKSVQTTQWAISPV